MGLIAQQSVAPRIVYEQASWKNLQLAERKEDDISFGEYDDGKKYLEVSTLADGIPCRIRMELDLYETLEFSKSDLLYFSNSIVNRICESGVGDAKHGQEIILTIKEPDIAFANRYLNVLLYIRFANNCYSYSWVPEQWKKINDKWECIRPADGWARIL
jgi:hypothetical protein